MKKKIHDRDESKEKTGEEMEAPGHGPAGEVRDQSTEVSVETSDETEQQAESDKAALEIKALGEKLAEMQDKYLRLSAEFDNYRKRTLKEKMELSKYAEENILSKIIPFMDDFDRAVQHLDTATDIRAMADGILLIYTKFSEFLKQNGVTEIESMNMDFNVEHHDAVAKSPVDDESKKGKVVDVILKGYFLRDKILRHAKVVVGE